MKAVVLAAGTGSRLGEITKARTKGMVPVAGKRLIDHLLDFFEKDFFDEIIIVGGYCYEDLRDHLKLRSEKNIRVIENPDYLKGNIFTLKRALNEFSAESFLITNVDHVYPARMFAYMKGFFTDIRAMCDRDRTLGPDDMKVRLESNGDSVKAISKKLDNFDCGYIGMTFVHESMDSVYREAVEKAVDIYGEKAVVENVLQVLADSDGDLPLIADLSGFGWHEVDDPDDLRRAEDAIEKNPGCLA